MRSLIIGAMMLASIAALAQNASDNLPDAPLLDGTRKSPLLIAKATEVIELSNPKIPRILVPGTRCCGIEFSDNHRFLDRKNKQTILANLVLQTGALLAIQSHGGGGGNWYQSRGRTLDPFEKHFESYGYKWGAVYTYGGCTVLPLAVASALHEN